MLIKKNENTYDIDSSLLDELLKDRTTGKNIIWATNNYSARGFKSTDDIKVATLINRKRRLIVPRNEKSKTEQQRRVKDKAEVFTPSWVCNKQNNLIDAAWFGSENVFNIEKDNGWETNKKKISFSDYQRDWKDYVRDIRIEITCGEAPYLTSRYDTVTGDHIRITERIGLLDRKLRAVNENCDDETEWVYWAKEAYRATYGYEYQGDNLLIARENLLFTFLDNYLFMFDEMPEDTLISEIIDIITWNIFQMDGLKYVVPDSCKNTYTELINIFGEVEKIGNKCPGCERNDPHLHNGQYVYIMDWEKKRRVKFLSLVKGV